MQLVQHSYSPSYLQTEKKQSIVSRFINWCNGQEKYRFGWLAITLTLHGCVLAPITVLSIALCGNNFVFWGIAIGAIAMPLVVNLAAMPTKVTIPVFVFSVLLDLVVIVGAFASLA
ncbi:MAG: hypothetical protein ABI675_17600 [Chitinophagaceae bacterium]